MNPLHCRTPPLCPLFIHASCLCCVHRPILTHIYIPAGLLSASPHYTLPIRPLAASHRLGRRGSVDRSRHPPQTSPPLSSLSQTHTHAHAISDAAVCPFFRPSFCGPITCCNRNSPTLEQVGKRREVLHRPLLCGRKELEGSGRRRKQRGLFCRRARPRLNVRLPPTAAPPTARAAQTPGTARRPRARRSARRCGARGGARR